MDAQRQYIESILANWWNATTTTTTNTLRGGDPTARRYHKFHRIKHVISHHVDMLNRAMQELEYEDDDAFA
jgi:hypothetical protein